MAKNQSGLIPPVNYPVLEKDQTLSNAWKNYYSSLYLFFNLNYSGNIPVIPHYSNSTRDAIDAPQNGMIIFNSDLNVFQGRQGGSWITFATS